jgi:NAD-dependent dihydropyrimidine dehydrogenase PreA subunit
MEEQELVVPIIDLAKCDGCGLCVESCPGKALGLVGGKAIILHPKNCLYDGTCEELCPQGAIVRPFQVVFEEDG